MKKILTSIIVLVCVLAGFWIINMSPKVTRSPEAAVETSGREGYKTAPDFALMDISGDETRLSDFRGKVVILDFWATWCPPCRAEIPHFIELYSEYKDNGLEIIGVTMDWNASRQAGPFAAENGMNYTVLIGDRKTADLYGGIVSIPTTFIIDREGGLRKKYIGYQDKSVFEKDIKELL
jgi:cytochrome c biogenesis protein CcmG/thiol:disulfide interchange protein DsbE